MAITTGASPSCSFPGVAITCAGVGKSKRFGDINFSRDQMQRHREFVLTLEKKEGQYGLKLDFVVDKSVMSASASPDNLTITLQQKPNDSSSAPFNPINFEATLEQKNLREQLNYLNTQVQGELTQLQLLAPGGHDDSSSILAGQKHRLKGLKNFLDNIIFGANSKSEIQKLKRLASFFCDHKVSAVANIINGIEPRNISIADFFYHTTLEITGSSGNFMNKNNFLSQPNLRLVIEGDDLYPCIELTETMFLMRGKLYKGDDLAIRDRFPVTEALPLTIQKEEDGIVVQSVLEHGGDYYQANTMYGYVLDSGEIDYSIFNKCEELPSVAFRYHNGIEKTGGRRSDFDILDQTFKLSETFQLGKIPPTIRPDLHEKIVQKFHEKIKAHGIHLSKNNFLQNVEEIIANFKKQHKGTVEPRGLTGANRPGQSKRTQPQSDESQKIKSRSGKRRKKEESAPPPKLGDPQRLTSLRERSQEVNYEELPSDDDNDEMALASNSQTKWHKPLSDHSHVPGGPEMAPPPPRHSLPGAGSSNLLEIDSDGDEVPDLAGREAQSAAVVAGGVPGVGRRQGATSRPTNRVQLPGEVTLPGQDDFPQLMRNTAQGAVGAILGMMSAGEASSQISAWDRRDEERQRVSNPVDTSRRPEEDAFQQFMRIQNAQSATAVESDDEDDVEDEVIQTANVGVSTHQEPNRSSSPVPSSSSVGPSTSVLAGGSEITVGQIYNVMVGGKMVPYKSIFDQGCLKLVPVENMLELSDDEDPAPPENHTSEEAITHSHEAGSSSAGAVPDSATVARELQDSIFDNEIKKWSRESKEVFLDIVKQINDIEEPSLSNIMGGDVWNYKLDQYLDQSAMIPTAKTRGKKTHNNVEGIEHYKVIFERACETNREAFPFYSEPLSDNKKGLFKLLVYVVQSKDTALEVQSDMRQ